MGKAVLYPVVDGARGEQAGPASMDAFENPMGIVDPEVGIMLPRKACRRQILGRRARPDCDGDGILMTFAAEPRVTPLYGFKDLSGDECRRQGV